MSFTGRPISDLDTVGLLAPAPVAQWRVNAIEAAEAAWREATGCRTADEARAVLRAQAAIHRAILQQHPTKDDR